MATKKKKVDPVIQSLTEFDLEARFASSMTVASKMEASKMEASKMEAGVDIERMNWAASVPFVAAIIDIVVDTTSRANRPSGPRDRALSLAIRENLEFALGHKLDSECSYLGVVQSIKIEVSKIETTVETAVYDRIVICVGPAPAILGGGDVLLVMQFARN
jgi:hypothetical protein